MLQTSGQHILRSRLSERTGRIRHETRQFAGRRLVHVVQQTRSEIGALQTPTVYRWIRQLMAGLRERGLRVLAWLICDDRIHLLCWANRFEQLARGCSYLFGQLGRRIRRQLGGRGSVFHDRYYSITVRKNRHGRAVLRTFGIDPRRAGSTAPAPTAALYLTFHPVAAPPEAALLGIFDRPARPPTRTPSPGLWQRARDALQRHRSKPRAPGAPPGPTPYSRPMEQPARAA